MVPFIVKIRSQIISDANIFSSYFRQILPFYTPWKYQKISGFLMFSEGIEMEQWSKMG